MACGDSAKEFGADGTEDAAGFAIVAATTLDRGGTSNIGFESGGGAMGGYARVDGSLVMGT
jgi:hypothetical protein